MRAYRGAYGSGRTAQIEDEVAMVLRKPGAQAAVITFPHTRWHWIARYTRRKGAAVGLTVTHWQRVYTEVLVQAGALRPAVSAAERVALVARGIAEVTGHLPSPGLALLMSQAIAEAKRFVLRPAVLAGHHDPEVRRLAEVWEVYEELKGAAQDPDDRREAALVLAKTGGVRLPYRYLAADGFREYTASELEFLAKVPGPAERVVAASEAGIALPSFADVHDFERRPAEPFRYALGNPVEEAEWVVYRVKELLGEGVPADEIAIVVPRGAAASFREVAAVLGLPLADETRSSLADTPDGHAVLLATQALQHPSLENLRAWPGLEPLARRMAELGVSGWDSTEKLAEALGGEEPQRLEGLRRVARLAEQNPSEWLRTVLESVRVARGVDRIHPSVVEAGQAAAAIAERHPGTRVDHWWEALLRGAAAPLERGQGVLLVPPERVSGRRFAHAFVTSAYAGAYGAAESEDYFLPDSDALRQGERLPPRIRGRTRALFEELAGMAREVVITYPLSGAEGRLAPNPFLIPDPRKVANPPVRVRVSPGDAPWAPPEEEPLPQEFAGSLTAGELVRFAECGVRALFERVEDTRRTRETTWGGLLVRLAREPANDALRRRLGLGPREDGEEVFAVGRYPSKRGLAVRYRVPLLRQREGERHLHYFADLEEADSAEDVLKALSDGWRAELVVAASDALREGVPVWVWLHSVSAEKEGKAFSLPKGRPLAVEDLLRSPLARPVRAFSEALERAAGDLGRGVARYAPNPQTCFRCPWRVLCRRNTRLGGEL